MHTNNVRMSPKHWFTDTSNEYTINKELQGMLRYTMPLLVKILKVISMFSITK